MINERYEFVAKNLGIPDLALALARGEIQIPFPGTEVPAGHYGLPAALLPLWSQGSGPLYVGYWSHWFVSRKPTIVRCYVEGGYRVIEIARSVEQLIRLVALEGLSMYGMGSEVREFAANAGIDDLALIDEISLDTGDDLRGLMRHPLFAADPPLASVTNGSGYHGDFPHLDNEGHPTRLDTAAGLEISDDLMPQLATNNTGPPWLRVGDQQSLFNEYLTSGALGKAWLSLNSPSWRFSDIKSALKQMNDAARTTTFSALVAAWTSLPQEEYGGF
jgi:hypothetical protein